jgi:hypothetical protein
VWGRVRKKDTGILNKEELIKIIELIYALRYGKPALAQNL